MRVLVIGHVGANIEAGDVDAEVASTNIRVGYGAVDVEFCFWHLDSR